MTQPNIHLKGFKLEFVFSENPYFTDLSLFKTYYLSNNPESPFGDMIYDRAEGYSFSLTNYFYLKKRGILIHLRNYQNQSKLET